jgi:hypothetical protein
MSERLVSSWKAPYVRGEAVYACPPPARHARNARLEQFASHVTLMARSPSVFEPRACLDGELPPVRSVVERLDWNAGRWEVLDRRGMWLETIPAEEMLARYVPCPLDPFMFAPADAVPIEVEARIEEYDGFFVADGKRIEDPLKFFRGLIRVDAEGKARTPADAPLFVQSIPILRGGDAGWVRSHLMQVELIWRLLRSSVSERGAWADMKVAADLMDHPNQVRMLEEHASAMTSAFTSAMIAILEIKERGGVRPALVPPRPSWDHQR